MPKVTTKGVAGQCSLVQFEKLIGIQMVPTGKEVATTGRVWFESRSAAIRSTSAASASPRNHRSARPKAMNNDRSIVLLPSSPHKSTHHQGHKYQRYHCVHDDHRHNLAYESPSIPALHYMLVVSDLDFVSKLETRLRLLGGLSFQHLMTWRSIRTVAPLAFSQGNTHIPTFPTIFQPFSNP